MAHYTAAKEKATELVAAIGAIQARTSEEVEQLRVALKQAESVERLLGPAEDARFDG